MTYGPPPLEDNEPWTIEEMRRFNADRSEWTNENESHREIITELLAMYDKLHSALEDIVEGSPAYRPVVLAEKALGIYHSPSARMTMERALEEKQAMVTAQAKAEIERDAERERLRAGLKVAIGDINQGRTMDAVERLQALVRASK